MNSYDETATQSRWARPPDAGLTGNGDGHLDFISGKRSETEFVRAQEHSKRVRWLKIFMPVVGLFIIAGVSGALLVRQFIYPELQLDAIALQDGKLIMENPTLSGTDQQKRPFTLSAEKAIQDADQPKRVELLKIRAQLPVDDAMSAALEAGNGIYDADEKTLILSERVEVTTDDGMRIELEDANVDIDKGTLETTKPIFASSREADIMSESLFVQDNGRYIVFEGNVRLTLRPKEMRRANDVQE